MERTRAGASFSSWCVPLPRGLGDKWERLSKITSLSELSNRFQTKLMRHEQGEVCTRDKVMKGFVSPCPPLLCEHPGAHSLCSPGCLRFLRTETQSHHLGPDQSTALHWVLWHQGCSVLHVELIHPVSPRISSASSSLLSSVPTRAPSPRLPAPLRSPSLSEHSLRVGYLPVSSGNLSLEQSIASLHPL